MKYHRNNVTRVFDVNERQGDALRRGMGDLIAHVFYHRVSLTVQYGMVSYKYNVRTLQIQYMYRINTRYALHKYSVRIL